MSLPVAFNVVRGHVQSHALHRHPHQLTPLQSRNRLSFVVCRAAQSVPDEAYQILVKQKPKCYGCGVELQVDDEALAGFVPASRLVTKAQHKKQLQQVSKPRMSSQGLFHCADSHQHLLCARCQALSNGAMIPAVEDFSQKVQAAALTNVEEEPLELNGKRLLRPEQLRDQLKGVASKKCLVVLLVDLLDASGSFLPRVRDLVGANPIILIGTKADLLPSGTKPEEVEEWLMASAAHKRLNVVAAHVVSSRSGEGLGTAAASLRRRAFLAGILSLTLPFCGVHIEGMKFMASSTGNECLGGMPRRGTRERRGRDVYVLGAANVGKSAFVRAFVKEMSSYSSRHFDAAALEAARRLPVESAMPGTTLGIIPMNTFSAGGTLFDTPGVHLHHRLAHLLSPEELKTLHPRRKLRPYVPPTPDDIVASLDEGADADANDHSPSAAKRGVNGASVAGGSGILHDASGVGVPAEPDLNSVTSVKMSDLAWNATDDELLTLFGPLVGSSEGKAGFGVGSAGSLLDRVQEDQDTRAKRPSSAKQRSPTAKGTYRPACATYLWGGVARIDVLTAPAETTLAFYGPPCMHVEPLPLLDEEDVVELDHHAEDDGESVGLFGHQSVLARGGLKVVKEVTMDAVGLASPLGDITVSGLPGWVSVQAPRAAGPVVLRLWAPRGVEVFVRPPLPVPSAVQQ